MRFFDFSFVHRSIVRFNVSYSSAYSHRTIESFCHSLYVDISGFDKFTADALNENTTLQSTMTVITYDAILQSASSIHSTFFVDFQDASGDLSITFSLCGYEQQTLDLLDVIIELSKADIIAAISAGLATAYGIDSESITVAFSFDEFGFYIINITVTMSTFLLMCGMKCQIIESPQFTAEMMKTSTFSHGFSSELLFL